MELISKSSADKKLQLTVQLATSGRSHQLLVASKWNAGAHLSETVLLLMHM